MNVFLTEMKLVCFDFIILGVKTVKIVISPHCLLQCSVKIKEKKKRKRNKGNLCFSLKNMTTVDFLFPHKASKQPFARTRQPLLNVTICF